MLPRKIEISSPAATPQKRFLVKDPKFASKLTAQASRGKSRRSGWDRCAATVFQMGFLQGQFAAFHDWLFSPLFRQLWTTSFILFIRN